MVSIIMPTYNRAYIIERAIKSVLAQTCEDWELIVVDDASTDTTKQVVSKYLCSKIRYYVNSENKGANVSRNFGVECAKGEILTFLDSDNYWPKDRLEVQNEILKAHYDQRVFAYGKTQITDGEDVKIVPEKIPTIEELKQIEIRKNVVDTNTIMIRKSLFLEIGGFDKDIPRLQDWEMVLRMLYNNKIDGIGCNEILCFNEIQENSIGKDETKFWIAMSILCKKYMYKYLPAEEIVQLLLWISNKEKISNEWRQNIIDEICLKNPKIVFAAMEQLQVKEEKLQNSYQMEKLLYEWHKKNLCSQEGTLFSEYFHDKSEIKTIAIYGLGKLGELFYDEVKKLPVKIAYGIDRTKDIFESIPIKRPGDVLEAVDWIIVSVLKDCERIKEDLGEQYPYRVVTLMELVVGTFDNR